jgi:hypothetical protein
MSNDDDKQFILDQQRKRFTVLKFIWQETKTQPKDSLSYSTAKDIVIKIGIDDDDLLGIFQYLESEGLIELLQYMGQLPLSRITHRGKIEIENAIIKPNEDTEHFLSSVIVNIATMNQTNINAGRDANGIVVDSQINAPVTNSISNIQQSVETSEILQVIADLRQLINKLAEENQDIAADALDTLESEVTTPTKPTKLKSILFTLWGVAQGVATFANAVTAIADRFGIHLHN